MADHKVEKCQSVKIDPRDYSGTIQESDFLEMMNEEEGSGDPGTEHVRLISLGSYCGPKLSFKKIGRGAASMPFDWVRVRLEGVLHFLRNNFAGFFEFVTRTPVPGVGSMIMYRGYYHSFWHDDPTDSGMKERYTRRIARFWDMARDVEREPALHVGSRVDAFYEGKWYRATTRRGPDEEGGWIVQCDDDEEGIVAYVKTVRPIQMLFVRTAGCHDEVPRAEELLNELQARFGRHAALLFILDFQKSASGAGIVQSRPDLLVYFVTSAARKDVASAPYGQAVLTALDWMVGRPIDAMAFPSMTEVAMCTDETAWGYDGLGGLRAFEDKVQESSDGWTYFDKAPSPKLPHRLPAVDPFGLQDPEPKIHTSSPPELRPRLPV